MKKTILFTAMILTTIAASLQAQNEYRIKQQLPDNIDSIEICSGWVVKLNQANEASLTIVTPCEVFYEEDSEPLVCNVEGQCLSLLENKSMPKSTVIEINVTKPLRKLRIDYGANVETGNLQFGKYCLVDVGTGKSDANNDRFRLFPKTSVKGGTWHSEGKISLFVNHEAELKLDSIVADKSLYAKVHSGATLECPVVLSPETNIKKDVKSFGTDYQSDSTINMTVKLQNRNWMRYFDALTLSGGISAPIPLYMNNKSGSAYNRGENYRFCYIIGVTSGLPLTKRLTFTPRLLGELDWSRLLNSVKTDGNSLTLDNSVGAERPHQLLYSASMGLDFHFNYDIGRKNAETGRYPLALNFGLALLSNGNSSLVTRTMGTDNRWHRTREEANVFNPFQIRASVGIGGGSLFGPASLNLFYDLLPTFKSGIGADKLHTFGISINF